MLDPFMNRTYLLLNQMRLIISMYLLKTNLRRLINLPFIHDGSKVNSIYKKSIFIRIVS